MDHDYVPPQRREYEARLMFSFEGFQDVHEDSLIFVLFRVLRQQPRDLGCFTVLVGNDSITPCAYSARLIFLSR